MPQPLWLDPSPFFYPAGRVGCLLIHGFTGSPPEMRPMAEYLHARGITVSGPLLTGHGTTPQQLGATGWRDWYRSVTQAYDGLAGRCAEVFVAGLSLGSLLAVHLAVGVQDLAGLVLISPAFWVRDWRLQLVPLLRHLVRMWPKDLEVEGSDLSDPEARNRYWCYDVHPTAALHQLLVLQRLTRQELASVLVPTLVVYSTRDRDVGGFCGQRTYASLGAADKQAMVLHNSGHCLVVDGEREAVFERVHSWMQVHGRTLARPAVETNLALEGE